MKSKGKVFVGMSGGVDSSVSAAVLKKAGYDVTGAFIKVWQPEGMPCTWKDERRDAMRVAALLDIPFVTIDLEDEYKKEVVDYMIDEYKKGRTPNPDVMCNKEIKFGSFLKKAMEMGADYVATGHYAKNHEVLNMKGGQNEKLFCLGQSKDKEKDQTYFLWTLKQDQLKRIIFPIGHMTKPEVRNLAKKFGLPTSDKKDSQGLCFIGKVDMKDFLKMFIKEKSGKVLSTTGEEIGHHEGATFYTVGQRHGFVITKKTTDDAPYYIIKKDVKDNVLVVSNEKKDYDVVTNQSSKEFILSDFNDSSSGVEFGKKYQARIRYRQPLQSCRLEETERGEIKIVFDKPQEAPARGQSVVIYDKELCLGGGVL